MCCRIPISEIGNVKDKTLYKFCTGQKEIMIVLFSTGSSEDQMRWEGLDWCLKHGLSAHCMLVILFLVTFLSITNYKSDFTKY